MELGVTKGYTARLYRREGLTGPRGNQSGLLFGKGGEQVQHERIPNGPRAFRSAEE
jgi:hypothetical protein